MPDLSVTINQATFRESLDQFLKSPAVQEILGLMIMQTCPIAHCMRAAGTEIPTKTELEQAHVLTWLLGIAADKGPYWAFRCSRRIKADGRRGCSLEVAEPRKSREARCLIRSSRMRFRTTFAWSTRTRRSLSIDEYEAMRATFFAGMAVALEWDAGVIRRELAEYVAAKKKGSPKEKFDA